MGALIFVMILVGLANGPWLRVRAVSYDGAAWTQRSDLDRVVKPIVGASLLLLDTAALREQLAALPAVESASVDVGVFGSVQVSVVEGGAVAVWRTSAGQLLLAEDGTVIGIQALGAAQRGSLVGLPVITDGREASHNLTVGDAVPVAELDAALALTEVRPVQLGSQAGTLSITVDETYGFIVSSPQAGWQAAFGFYGLDPSDTPDATATRIRAQSDAIRTLFGTRPEAQLAWIDARNPAKVYFRARG